MLQLPRTPWAESPAELARVLETDLATGLSGAEAARRLRDFGPNRPRAGKQRSVWSILWGQIRNLIVVMLAVAAGLAYSFGDWLEGSAILAAIGLSVVVGFVTEWRALRSMQALSRLSEVSCFALREGARREIPAAELVPGDIVPLEAGDVIPADLRVVESARLMADESALTGESIPVAKQVEAVAAGASIDERTSMLFKGSGLSMGSGLGLVVATGMATELGHIQELVETAEETRSPLHQRLQLLGRKLLIVTLIIAGLIAVLGLVMGQSPLLVLETAIALAVAAVPEGLPVVATIALARGMWRMARKNAIVSQLPAVETLGATQVVCTDKTGTLTENRMTLTELALPALGDDASGGRGLPAGPIPMKEGGEAARWLLLAGTLCNNASLGREDEAGLGDPMEVALLEAGRAHGLDRDELLKAWPEEREEAFDPVGRRMATFHAADDDSGIAWMIKEMGEADASAGAAKSATASRANATSAVNATSDAAAASDVGKAAKAVGGAGAWLVMVKGAPEAVLEVCASALGADGRARPLDDEARRAWERANEELAGRGLRVLGFARGWAASLDADPYEGLELLGLAGLMDPPREGVAEAVALLREAGVRVVMITGDQPATANAIARAVGIGREGEEAVSGRDIEGMTPDELCKRDIFARVSPESKLRLVEALQARGRVVAMTGDGVNDAPALKKADIGVAMGRRGTQVAREAADMVLKDDFFGTIAAAVEQGRIIFNNLRKFIVYLLSGNVGEIAIVAVALPLTGRLPLLPLQILYLNMLGDVFPALALGVGPGDRVVMADPPRASDEPILTRRLWLLVGAYAALIAVSVLGVFLVALWGYGWPHERAVTVAFLGLAFGRLLHTFNMRDHGSGFVSNDITRNPWNWGALALCSGLLALALRLPILSQALGLVDPGPEGWTLVAVAAFLPFAVAQPVKSLMGRRRRG